MQLEKENKLPFLDILVEKNPDGSLGHSMYRKPTHTDLYLHAESEHHPAQKRTGLLTLVCRARAICDTDSLEAELLHLKRTLRKNGYSELDIYCVLCAKNEQQKKM
jgi:hypothetical protein